MRHEGAGATDGSNARKTAAASRLSVLNVPNTLREKASYSPGQRPQGYL
jgi:hypothetical protein